MRLPANYNKLNQVERKTAREQYMKEQNFKCSHCVFYLRGMVRSDIDNKPINWSLFPPNFQEHPIHLHHDHKTGMTIGAVHMKCNAVLWQYHGE